MPHQDQCMKHARGCLCLIHTQPHTVHVLPAVALPVHRASSTNSQRAAAKAGPLAGVATAAVRPFAGLLNAIDVASYNSNI